MEKLNYKKMLELIESYCEGKLYVDLEISNDEEKRQILKDIFRYIDDETLFGKFNVRTVDDLKIVNYQIYDYVNGKTIQNMVLSRTDGLTFKIEHSEPNDNLGYQKDIFSVYDKNSRLINRISSEQILNINHVKVLDKYKKSGEYNNKDYTFYDTYGEGSISGLRVGNMIWISSELSFNERLNAAKRLINEVANKIDDSFNEILKNEKVKIYTISRKKQEQ